MGIFPTVTFLYIQNCSNKSNLLLLFLYTAPVIQGVYVALK